MENGMVIIQRLAKVVNRFGVDTGNPVNDVILLCIFLAAVAFVLALLLYIRQRTKQQNRDGDGFDRMGGVLGRLEKLEMTVNQFKTETARSFELFRGDVGYLKQDLIEIKKALSINESSPGGSGSSGGGGGAGGGGGGVEVMSNPNLDLPVSESRRSSAPGQKPEALSSKLLRTRTPFFSFIKGLFIRKDRVDDEMLDDIEVQLVSADVGIKTARTLVEEVKREVAGGVVLDQLGLIGAIKGKILKLLEDKGTSDTEIVPAKRADGPQVIMLVGVNGAGKTTTAAKLAAKWKTSGAKVLLVAADTYRAAAVDQLVEWGRRIGVPVVAGASDSKPSTVVFDAMQRAKSENVDVVLIDTAGRLHTKSNLMQELQGVRNVMQKSDSTAPHETILVLDGTTGTNALSQAKEFNDAVPLTGLVVTKLDGTPKGGIVVAVKAELGIPVRYIGVGESKDDLRPFVAKDFADALFNPPEDLVSSTNAEARKRKRGSGSGIEAILSGGAPSVEP